VRWSGGRGSRGTNLYAAFRRTEADGNRSSHGARSGSALPSVCFGKNARDPMSGPPDLRRRQNSRADERQIVLTSQGRNRPFAEALTAWDESYRRHSVRRCYHGIHLDLRENYRHLRHGNGRPSETRLHGNRLENRLENRAGHAHQTQPSGYQRGRTRRSRIETGISRRWVSALPFPPPIGAQVH
jgi:hypothetical protein